VKTCEVMMGANCSHTPVGITAATPAGRSRGGLNPG